MSSTLDERAGEAPLLTVYGGKITTYRRLAEQALERLAHVIPAGPAWTADSHLPGGEFPHDGLEALIAKTRRSRPFLSEAHARRLVRAYGTRVERVLGPARRMEDLGPCLGADLTAAEVRYLMEREWAQTADDVLWRRTQAGLALFARTSGSSWTSSWPTGPAIRPIEGGSRRKKSNAAALARSESRFG